MAKKTAKRVAVAATFIFMSYALTSCYVSQTQETDTKDLSYIYNPARNIFNPDVTLFNENESTTLLSISLRRNESYFSEANPSGAPVASLLLSVRLFDVTLGGSLADTASIRYELNRADIGDEYVFKVPLTAFDGKSYTTEIKIVDLVRQRTVHTFVDFDRTGPNCALNYRIRDHFSRQELYNYVVKRDQFINVQTSQPGIDTLWLFYYRPVKAIPPPPSTVLPEVTVSDKPDAIIPLAYSDTLPMMLPREGIYLLSTDSLVREGLTLFNFGADFPTMTSPETLIPPMAYIASKEEIDSMLSAEKPKLALDNFWLSRTNSIERSKELIRIYYNRTLFANFYFTSYKEGWLTDRGMVYIVYGPPDKVYKNYEGESWGYLKAPVKSSWGERYSSSQDNYLWFNFKRQKNVFTGNDFVLNRAGTPVSYWDIAVSRWREGKVFRLETDVTNQ